MEAAVGLGGLGAGIQYALRAVAADEVALVVVALLRERLLVIAAQAVERERRDRVVVLAAVDRVEQLLVAALVLALEHLRGVGIEVLAGLGHRLHHRRRDEKVLVGRVRGIEALATAGLAIGLRAAVGDLTGHAGSGLAAVGLFIQRARAERVVLDALRSGLLAALIPQRRAIAGRRGGQAGVSIGEAPAVARDIDAGVLAGDGAGRRPP